AGDISGNISKQLDGNYVASSWQVMNRALFSALKLEKLMMFIVVTLIVLVASFNIVSNLLLFCIEKIKDIGILTALGATRKNIRKIFLFEGIMMGLVGILLGSGLGVLISVLLDKYRVIRLPADVYYLDRLPVRVAIADVTVVVLSAFIIVLVSTFYPAKKAAETDPLEAIRYG
ncbi:MAG: FtsX-like permease family protein, partial [Elusimicrobia bacterium]|nr:FtsX-like permease family protein [Elusimicrobiota bacterium]